LPPVAAALHDDADIYAEQLVDMLFLGILSPDGRRNLRAATS
jgi:hypothetical protein